MNRLRKEMTILKDLKPAPSYSAGPLNDDIFQWQGILFGPENSPYEGGTFFVDIKYPIEYPMKPPELKFVTKIFHCNISPEGGICFDLLKKDWSPTVTIVRIMEGLENLLKKPNPEDPLNPDIANMYLNNREEHDLQAKDWTTKYAK